MFNKYVATKKGALIILVAGLLLVGSTLAYLNAVLGTSENKFSSIGKVNVGVVETTNNNDEKIYENGNGMNLGNISNVPTTKIVSIKNIDSVSYPTTNTYVRVRLVPTFIYDSGVHAGQVVATNISTDQIKYELNTTNWSAKEAINGETYYYYKNILAPGAVSENLLSSVTYTGVIPDNSHFELEVLVDGVSANSTGILYSSAMEAWQLSDNNMWANSIAWNEVFSENIKAI